MTKCPKCNYDRKPNDKECPRCGIIYEKYESYIDKRKSSEEPEKPIEVERIIKEETKTEKESIKNITSCRHCEKEVAVSAKKCPHCGGETPGFTKQQAATAKSIRTVINIVFLLGIIIFLLVAKYLSPSTCDKFEKNGKDIMNKWKTRGELIKSTDEMGQ